MHTYIVHFTFVNSHMSRFIEYFKIILYIKFFSFLNHVERIFLLYFRKTVDVNRQNLIK